MPGRKSEITQEQYESLKARGLSDSAISDELKINKSSVSRAKRKWGIESSRPKSSCTESNEPASGVDSNSTLSMLRDSLIEVRETLLKEISKKPDKAERSIDTLVKLSGEIRQAEIEIEKRKANLTDRATIFGFFRGVFGIIQDEVDLNQRRIIAERIKNLRNPLAKTDEVKTVLNEGEVNE